jgi:hypothetical protein
MDEITRDRFGKEFNRAVGSYLLSLRNKADMSLENAARAFGEHDLERIQRIESGEEPLRSDDLRLFIERSGADPAEVLIAICRITEKLRARYREIEAP